MQIGYQAFWIPKFGNAVEEYEDAFSPISFGEEQRTPEFRCAVSDGASESTFSSLWAQLLVHAYSAGQFADADSLCSILTSLQSSWKEKIDTTDLSWFAEEKLQTGAFATLTGLTLANSEGSRIWRAFAIGDSCIFHIRGDELLNRFPMRSAEEFSYSPNLLSSSNANVALEDLVRTCEGEWTSGDMFYLMTDALSQWFLAWYEQARDPIGWLGMITDQNEFDTYVEEWRKPRSDPSLKNDDVTLLRILAR